MKAKKKLDNVGDVADEQLRQDIENAASSENDADTMLKDAHLVEAALAADQTIISLDDAARSLFAALTERVRQVGAVMWINPAEEPQQVIKWLEQGAPPRKERTLLRLAQQAEQA
jgi:hypothetical protein